MEEKDKPVAFELAVPAGLTVDGLAGALGRRAAVVALLAGAAGSRGLTATNDSASVGAGDLGPLLLRGGVGVLWHGLVLVRLGERAA